MTRSPKRSKKNGDGPRRIGVWLIGVHGGLATTLMVGTRMIARGQVSAAGLLTETPPFDQLPLASLDHVVFGGHDIRNHGVFQTAYEIYRENGTFDLEKLEAVKDDLDAIDDNVRLGTTFNCGSTIGRLGTARSRKRPERPRELVERFQADISEFRSRHDLDTVVVVNVASTEPPLPEDKAHLTLKGTRALLDGPASDARKRVPASLIYAWAAVGLGCPFINFTPNGGSLVRSVQLLARQRRVPLMGNDGKTGETLVKSALAPMFKYRNLKVLTWQGYNILGDRDGQVLADPANKRTKIKSKDGVLSHILGYPLHTHVGIDYVPSLKDLKTAWDFIHFQGFLDYKMSLQFTWQGCDAILAAPVVMDMVRLADYAARKDEAGLMTWLSCFFKSPVGVDEHDLHFQFHHLMDYARTHISGKPWNAKPLVATPGDIHLPKRKRRRSTR